MNPFLFNGPLFLLFYFLLGAALFAMLRRWLPRGPATYDGDILQFASDPYRIAYLNDDIFAAVQITTLALIDRGLLQVVGTKLTAADGALDFVQRPIEKDVLRHYAKPRSVVRSPTERSYPSCAAYRKQLEQLGVLMSSRQRWRHDAPINLTVAVLAVTGIIKLAIAIVNGKHNILLLIALFIAFFIYGSYLKSKRISPAGDELLSHLRAMFSGLKRRKDKLKTGGENNEAVLLAAVFGVNMVPNTVFPFGPQLYPVPASASGGSGGSDSSSGGSSCSSGCGSGCGGGCGGCGS